jgi:hypothetical protein
MSGFTVCGTVAHIITAAFHSAYILQETTPYWMLSLTNPLFWPPKMVLKQGRGKLLGEIQTRERITQL